MVNFKTYNMIEDLTLGTDSAGEECLYVESKHILGWDIDKTASASIRELIGRHDLDAGSVLYFIELEDGRQTSSDGFIDLIDLSICHKGVKLYKPNIMNTEYKSEYKLAQGYTNTEFSHCVTALLNEGWELYSLPFIYPGPVFYQALVKKTPKED
jgi:hypothetical protein